MTNQLALEIYKTGVEPIVDVDGSLAQARVGSFATYWPGGLYGDTVIRVPHHPLAAWQVRKGQRLVLRNGAAVVYEGKITRLRAVYDRPSSTSYTLIFCRGYWEALLARRTWNKRWCDSRISDDAWRIVTGLNGSEKCSIDREGRLRFTPKGVAWSNSDYAQLIYSMPTGSTVKRFVLSYNLQEGAQAWQLGADVGATLELNRTASGSGSSDVTTTTPNQNMDIFLMAKAGQTPTEDGTYFGEVSGLKVYSELGGITPTSVMQNIRAYVAELAATNVFIESNSLTLEPFMSDGQEFLTSIMLRAAGYGDSSYNAWAPLILASELSGLGDGKPVLAFRQAASIDGYDYAIRLDEDNVQLPISIDDSLEAVSNWVAMNYEGESLRYVVTPDDDANLKDTTSITAWGELHQVLDVKDSDLTRAKQWARRHLKTRKDPSYNVAEAIRVRGTIRDSDGQPVPVCQVAAGARLKIENYGADVAGVSGAGFTQLITSTNYTPANGGEITLNLGIPDRLAIMRNQRELGLASAGGAAAGR